MNYFNSQLSICPPELTSFYSLTRVPILQSQFIFCQDAVKGKEAFQGFFSTCSMSSLIHLDKIQNSMAYFIQIWSLRIWRSPFSFPLLCCSKYVLAVSCSSALWYSMTLRRYRDGLAVILNSQIVSLNRTHQFWRGKDETWQMLFDETFNNYYFCLLVILFGNNLTNKCWCHLHALCVLSLSCADSIDMMMGRVFLWP